MLAGMDACGPPSPASPDPLRRRGDGVAVLPPTEGCADFDAVVARARALGHIH